MLSKRLIYLILLFIPATIGWTQQDLCYTFTEMYLMINKGGSGWLDSWNITAESYGGLPGLPTCSIHVFGIVFSAVPMHRDHS
ncbi:MAG: hypothetical protein JXB49_33150 [Bacteroidales bacterium]|nr:hypothetical protein [Bacteroidales bacterium]